MHFNVFDCPPRRGNIFVMSKKVLIVGNFSKEGVAEQIETLRGWLESRCILTAVVGVHDELDEKTRRADLCLVFGGDGTLLSAARSLAGTKTAMMGVNMGKLGFLAEFSVEDFKSHLDAVLAGRIEPAERMMLEVRLETDGRDAFTSPAANDVAICAGPPFRMIDLHVAQAGANVAQYLGDGLVIATPTGSTGYNLSTHGPILDPTLDAVTITPIAPHTLTMRPIVVRSDKPVEILAQKVNAGSQMLIDGQVTRPLSDGDVVRVSRAQTPMLLISHPQRGFFRTLCEKLSWGRSPHHL